LKSHFLVLRNALRKFEAEKTDDRVELNYLKPIDVLLLTMVRS